MEPNLPRFSARDATEEPWRLVRLARTDGRVREIMRVLTREPPDEMSPIGEIVWARHVLRLHDDRGTLVVSISHELARSPWLSVVTAALRRAWESEDEAEVTLLLPDGRGVAASELLPDLALLAPPDIGLAERPAGEDPVVARAPARGMVGPVFGRPSED